MLFRYYRVAEDGRPLADYGFETSLTTVNTVRAAFDFAADRLPNDAPISVTVEASGPLVIEGLGSEVGDIHGFFYPI